MKTAEEMLYIYLGGNLNVGTLTESALTDIMDSYADYKYKEENDRLREALTNISNQHYANGIVCYNGSFIYIPEYASKVLSIKS